MYQCVEEIGNPNTKQRKLTDFFQKLQNTDNSQLQELPEFLRQFQPTDVLHRQKQPVLISRDTADASSIHNQLYWGILRTGSNTSNYSALLDFGRKFAI